MKVYLENRSATQGVEHNKFYLVETKNNDVFCKWGSVSELQRLANQYTQSGRVKIINCLNKQEAKAKLNEIIAKKQGRGYCIISKNAMRVNSRPTNGIQRKFGIEIETNTNLKIKPLLKKLKAQGVKAKRVAFYTKTTGKYWEVKNDSSCGFEIASPIINGEAGIFDFKLCIDKISQCLTGHHPDSNCGIHITVSTEGFTTQQQVNLIKNFSYAEDHFYAMCNESRQDNDYCKQIGYPLSGNTIAALKKHIKRCWRGSVDLRYFGLNITKLPDCVEFRMFQSELSPRKVARWARACIGFVENAHNQLYSPSALRTAKAFKKLIS